MNAAVNVLSPARIRAVAPLNASCIACGEENVRGLHLRFTTREGTTSATWIPSSDWQGFEGVIHGGIVGTVLDEAMSKAVVARGWEALTVELKVRLRARIAPGENLRVEAMITDRKRRKIQSEAWIVDAAGSERAHAWGIFIVPR